MKLEIDAIKTFAAPSYGELKVSRLRDDKGTVRIEFTRTQSKVYCPGRDALGILENLGAVSCTPSDTLLVSGQI